MEWIQTPITEISYKCMNGKFEECVDVNCKSIFHSIPIKEKM